MTAPAGSTWQPQVIRRFIRHFDTGAGVIRVETDQGEGYAKVLGNPAGPHALAREWVCTALARWLGLLTFDCAIIPIRQENELLLSNGSMAEPGPAFITRAEKGSPWSGDAEELQLVENQSDLTLLVLCDTWLRNRDRWPGLDSRKPNRDNVFLSAEGAAPGRFLLKAMDFSHCLDRGDLSRQLLRIDCVKDAAVYGLFPEFRQLLDSETMRQGVDRLAALPKDLVRKLITSIPLEWSVDTETQEAMCGLIYERAHFVQSTIFGHIWPQQQLDFDGD